MVQPNEQEENANSNQQQDETDIGSRGIDAKHFANLISRIAIEVEGDENDDQISKFMNRYVYANASLATSWEQAEMTPKQRYIDGTEIIEVRNKLRDSKLLMKLLSDNRHGLRCLHHKYLLITCDIDTKQLKDRLNCKTQHRQGPSSTASLEPLEKHPPFEAAKEMFNAIQFSNS